MYNFSSEIIFGQLIETFGDFYLVTLISTSGTLLCSWQPQKMKQDMHDSIPYMFDYWADSVVHLLPRRSSMIQESNITSTSFNLLLGNSIGMLNFETSPHYSSSTR